MKRLIPIALLATVQLVGLIGPAKAYRDDGGKVAVYAQRVWSHKGPIRIGWFYSAAALWLGNPGSCVDSGSMVHIHPVTNPGQGRHVPFDNAFNDIISPHTTFDGVHSYASVMSQTPWGRRVFLTAERNGCFADPNGCNFYGQDLMALGVPVCRGGF